MASRKLYRSLLPLLCLGLCPACPPEQAAPAAPTPTVEQAQAFMKDTEEKLRKAWSDRERIGFVQLTYDTHDTETLAAQAEEGVMEFVAQKVKEAKRFEGLDLPKDLRRKIHLLKLAQTLPAPPDPQERGELAGIATFMESTYGKGKYCPKSLAGRCLTLDEMSSTMAKSRDYGELLDLWQGWRTIAPPMREKFVRYVELANKGAKDLGFADVGAMWRSNYDMPPEDFAKEAQRLWMQVEPLYKAMHCHVRARLREHYGVDKVPEGGPIPAHLLGNMWAQEWGNIYPLVAPLSDAKAYDLTAILRDKKVTPMAMVKYGEGFFVSLGLVNLPETFWQRSMFVRPRDREVLCHASAWDITSRGDLRLKMCIDIDEDNFQTVHHELGHDYYYWYYRDLPTLFQQGAHDGFHEAIGDTIALSITPSYLRQIDMLPRGTEPAKPANEVTSDGDIGQLLKRALDGVAFLPFGMLIDQWRWEVFSGKVTLQNYNAAWWELRTRYQGVAAPLARSETDFDPGAKYHIPANVPYMRYFLARILQYQFHRALCEAAGHKGPLHTCSIYDNKDAGEKLKAMLEMGASQTWPEALFKIAGTRQMDGGALLDYYKPLLAWLEEQNKGRRCGW